MFKWSGLYTGIYYTYTANKEEKHEVKHDDHDDDDDDDEGDDDDDDDDDDHDDDDDGGQIYSEMKLSLFKILFHVQVV